FSSVYSRHPRRLHSFPTRRSSDLLERQRSRDDYRRLVGIRMEDGGIPRHGYRVLLRGAEVGPVTSGTMSPSLRVGIALASVNKRSEEHTSELQSRFDLVCRLLLEK